MYVITQIESEERGLGWGTEYTFFLNEKEFESSLNISGSFSLSTVVS